MFSVILATVILLIYILPSFCFAFSNIVNSYSTLFCNRANCNKSKKLFTSFQIKHNSRACEDNMYKVQHQKSKISTKANRVVVARRISARFGTNPKCDPVGMLQCQWLVTQGCSLNVGRNAECAPRYKNQKILRSNASKLLQDVALVSLWMVSASLIYK